MRLSDHFSVAVEEGGGSYGVQVFDVFVKKALIDRLQRTTFLPINQDCLRVYVPFVYFYFTSMVIKYSMLNMLVKLGGTILIDRVCSILFLFSRKKDSMAPPPHISLKYIITVLLQMSVCNKGFFVF